MDIKKFAPVICLSSIISFSTFSLLCKFFASESGVEIYSQVFTTTLFIMGLAIGSIAIKYTKQTWNFFLFSEYLLSLFLFLIPLLLSIGLYFYTLPWWALAVFTALPLGVISGFELPIYLLQLDKTHTHKTLFFNYMGALIAGILIYVNLQENIPILKYFYYLGILNLVLIISIVLLTRKSVRVLGLGFVVASLFYYQSFGFFEKNYKYLYKLSYLQLKDISLNKALAYAKNTKPIYSLRSKYQKIDILPAAIFEHNYNNQDWGLFLNRKPQFFLSTEVIYHQTMAMYPYMYFNQDFKKILLLGGGDLGVVRELLKISDDSKIKVIELDERILKLAKNGPYLNEVSPRYIDPQRVQVVQDDALHFLKRNTEKFDLVLADFPYPTSFAVSKLYSKEFFSLVKTSLDNNGKFVLDFPIFLNSNPNDKALAIVLKTLNQAGFIEQHLVGVNDTFILNNIKNEKPSTFAFQKYSHLISPKTLTNLRDITSKSLKLNMSEADVHSLFKPARGFIVR